MPTAAIELDDIDVRIGGSSILRNVSWKLDAGACSAIVGENGAGKTSLLRVIAGRLWPAPAKGRRRYNFGDGWETDAVAALRYIAFVSQADEERFSAMGWNFPALRVVHSGITRTTAPRGPAKPVQTLQARAALRRLGASHLADRRFLELSRGERRRVLLARALAMEPRILVLDEGAAGLDPESRETLWDDLGRLSRDVSIITSHHDTSDVPHWINHRARVAQGRLTLLKPTASQTKKQMIEPVGSGVQAPSATTAWTIRLKRASFFIEGKPALRDLNWRLCRSEQWRIVGPNGSGKTTLLRALNGELHPARGGSIQWAGFSPADGRAQLQAHIGFVGPELEWRYRYPTTVWDCVLSGLTASIGCVRKATEHEATQVDATLSRFGIESLAARPLQTLSYAQRRLAMIARAVVKRPRWLLLDEPTEGLDPTKAHYLFEQLAVLAKGGCQVVCASHLDLSARWFTHELVLERGRICGRRNVASSETCS